MIRFRLIAAALVVLFVAPGAAQVPLGKPLVFSPQALPKLAPIELNEGQITKAATVEEAKLIIAQLQKERRETSLELKAALARINDMTKYGGSLVRAYCEGETISRSTAGVSEDCAQTGYNCDKVSGTCYRQAGTTEHCAEGYVNFGRECLTPAAAAQRAAPQ